MFVHYLLYLTRTVGGVHVHADQLTITVPTAMMVKALDILLDRMAEAKFPFEKVLAIGGDNQVCKVLLMRDMNVTMLQAYMLKNFGFPLFID